MAAPPLAYDADALGRVCDDLGLKLVVLFGSRATGTPPPTPESDLDLAVWAGTRLDFWACRKALADVFDGYRLDLALLERADPLFRHEIMRAGRCLWGDADRFADYRAFAYRAFVDAADLRALEDVLFRKKMAHLGRVLDGAA